ncbi:MAG: hypothetical protein AAGE94_24115, partial [Acidobacteriota bacterium]
STAPATSQQPAEPPSSLTGEPVTRPTVHFEGADVPYAIRADALLGTLAHFHQRDVENDTDSLDKWLRTMGFEPASAAAQELIEVAVALDIDHPRVPEFARAQAKAGEDIDLERPGGWSEQRYAKAGRAFGQWLELRQREGWAVDPLLDRMLNGNHLAVTYFSDQPDARGTLDRFADTFHQHLGAELGHLPHRFSSK